MTDLRFFRSSAPRRWSHRIEAIGSVHLRYPEFRRSGIPHLSFS